METRETRYSTGQFQPMCWIQVRERDMRTVLALTLSVILASAVQAEAGELVVLNCANDSRATIRIETFNTTDLVLIAPYDFKRIRPLQSATLRCETDTCVMKYKIPKKVGRPLIGMSVATTAIGNEERSVPKVGDGETSGRACFKLNYENGELMGVPIARSAGCGCD